MNIFSTDYSFQEPKRQQEETSSKLSTQKLLKNGSQGQSIVQRCKGSMKLLLSSVRYKLKLYPHSTLVRPPLYAYAYCEVACNIISPFRERVDGEDTLLSNFEYGKTAKKMASLMLTNGYIQGASEKEFLREMETEIKAGVCFGEEMLFLLKQRSRDELFSKNWTTQDRINAIFIQSIHNFSFDVKAGFKKASEEFSKHQEILQAIKKHETDLSKRLALAQAGGYTFEDISESESLEEAQKISVELVSVQKERLHVEEKLEMFQHRRCYDPAKNEDFEKGGKSAYFLEKAGFTLLGVRTIEKKPEAPQAFLKDLQNLLSGCFNNSKITDVGIGFENSTDDIPGHCIVFQPKQLRVYDASVGELWYKNKDELVKSLSHAITNHRHVKTDWCIFEIFSKSSSSP
jgi:hypothetical protein